MRAVLLLLPLVACEGPTGAAGGTGPTGATGPDGLDGNDGSTGADGTDGADGSDGSDGQPAHQGDAPWGVNVAIVSVSGASGDAFQVGDTPTVTFTVTDDDGIPYTIGELSGIEILFTGPTDHCQIVSLYDAEGWLVPSLAAWDAASEAWTFTFPEAIPATFSPPHNDTDAFGESEGDWGGLDLVDGTYTFALSAAAMRTLGDGTIHFESDSETMDVLFGAATQVESREVVTEAACQDCHGDDLYGHAGFRRELALCVACHVTGSEDRYSDVDAATTPDVTVGFAPLVHAIHMGEERNEAFTAYGYPANPYGEGYPDYNVYSFEGVAFPAFAGGPAECESCHGDAAQGDVESRPSRAACGSCHDGVDFVTGDGHGDGGAQDTDEWCTRCHSEGGEAGAIEEDHADPRDGQTDGIVLTIVEVTGGSGTDGAFLPGDTLSVAYTLTDDAGNARDISSVYYTDAVLSGPTDHYQTTVVASYNSLVYTSEWDEDASVYRYTLTTAIPETFPAQLFDTDDIGIEAGDWKDQPLVGGTYTVLLSAADIMVVDGAYLLQSSSATAHVLLDAEGDVTLREVVSEENCGGCHLELEYHGGVREGLDACLTCHTAGAEDRYSDTDASTTPGVTIDFRVLMHKLHNADELSEPLVVYGYPANPYGEGYPNYNVYSWEELAFPRFDGGAQACESCHAGSDAWEDPQTVACLSCHDTDDAAAHAAVNTDDTWGESCDVCHGSDREFAVGAMHDWMR